MESLSHVKKLKVIYTAYSPGCSSVDHIRGISISRNMEEKRSIMKFEFLLTDLEMNDIVVSIKRFN